MWRETTWNNSSALPLFLPSFLLPLISTLPLLCCIMGWPAFPLFCAALTFTPTWDRFYDHRLFHFFFSVFFFFSLLLLHGDQLKVLIQMTNACYQFAPSPPSFLWFFARPSAAPFCRWTYWNTIKVWGSVALIQAASGGTEVGTVADSGVIVQSADLTPTAVSISPDRGGKRGD